MSLVTKYSESPVRLMENQKLVEIQFPNTATEIIGLNTDNLTKIDVSKCSKDFVSMVKSSYQDKTNNSGDSIKVKEQPNNEIWYTASAKLSETTSTASGGLHTNVFNVTKTSHAFEDGKGVITFNGDVTTIGNFAFYKCSGLTSISIPDGVKIISQSAFDGCSGLISINIPNSVIGLTSSAFSNCTGLTSISIPDKVSAIPPYTFFGCSGLTSITIPDVVTTIGNYAFKKCTGITSVIYKGTTYTSKSALESALSSNGVTIGTDVFDSTQLSS